MAEPVSLDLLKAHLRLDPDDALEDAYLSGRIVAARRACEAHIGRPAALTTRTTAIDGFPPLPPGWSCVPWQALDCGVIELPDARVASITAISYRSASGLQVVDPASYGADLVNVPARIFPLADWPDDALDQPGAVTITFVESPLSADDLELLVQAMLLLVGHWYRDREAGDAIPRSLLWLLDGIRGD